MNARPTSFSPQDTKVFHRQLRSGLPVAVAGQGVELVDATGKRYIDASGGAAVSCLGHGHPDVIAAMHGQIDRLAYAHTSFFTTEVAEELATLLIDSAPQGMSHVYFVSGGSEAVEAALKMARQYFVELGQPQREHFIARRQSYHGNTLGALAVGGNAWRREQFKPLLIDVTHVSPCYEYRDRRADETPEQYGQRLVAELSDAIDRLGGQNVMAFVAETIGGATAGVLTPVPGYFKGVRELCDRHGILLILDEVMCGMGRSGTLHACEQEGVVPDLLTIAKGLGGGYQPIGAVLAQGKLVEAFRRGSGLFQHGHTYLGHAVACAAALAVQRVIIRDGLLSQVVARGATLQAFLQQRFGDHPHVGDIRGRGLFWGVELVADRASKQWFDPARKLHARIKVEAMTEGLMVYPMSGTVDGVRGDHILLAPPFITSEAELAQIVHRLGVAVDRAIAVTA
ncbi:aspartate aminotransferase family protein [Hydrogenophaga sp. PAMC20947]|uniref:aspartate aminotransferase family protein n=1 Tax=Hydrogenophaga sp. PAMC20947 TaxID=2565558 RepID=UPI00109DE305|nr:aspartate aminotransferase family protein [Hydrogenophaga sp. PAMC20947]QCB45086.1 aspartate aminotransferase family protein [Hydrogenophaga sp. PAMC20947]